MKKSRCRWSRLCRPTTLDAALSRLASTSSDTRSTPRRVKSLNAGNSYVEDISDEELSCSGRIRQVHGDPQTRTTLADFDYAIITVPTPLREGIPDLSYIEDAAARTGWPSESRCNGRAGVDDLSGNHRGARRAHPRGDLGPEGRHGLLLGLQPRANRPRQQDLDVGQHAQGRRPVSTLRPSRRFRSCTTHSSTRRCQSPRSRRRS